MNCSKKKYQIPVKASLIIAVLCCHFLTGLAQPKAAPSLRTQLQKSKPDSGRVKILLQISNYLSDIPAARPATLDSALRFSAQAEKLSLSLSYVKGQGNSDMATAKVYLRKKDEKTCNAYVRKAIDVFTKANLIRDAAESYLKLEEYYAAFGGKDFKIRAAFYEQALLRFRQAGARNREADTLKILGDFYQILTQYAKALEDLKLALTIYQSIGMREVQSTYDLLGSISAQIGDYKEALRYGLLAIKTAELVHDNTLQLCTIYNRVGLTYYYLKQYSKAGDYFKKALAIAEKYHDADSGIIVTSNLSTVFINFHQYEKALTLLKYISKKYYPLDLLNQAQLDALFVNVYILLKQYTLAEPYCNRLIKASEKLTQYDGDKEVLQHAIALYFAETKQDVLARKYLGNFKSMAERHHNKASLAGAYLMEFKLDSAQGNYQQAIKNYQKYTVLNDSLFNATKSRQIAQLDIQYQVEQKENELKIKEQNIQLLTKQGQLQQINLKQERTTRNMIIIGAVLLALLLGLNYNRYRLKQRINRQLQVQQNEISQKNRSLTSLVREKDDLLEEKEWLMKEIHHRVKNNLQIVISLLNTQSIYIKNDVAFNAIRESQHRMQSISLIHQKLYQSENLALVDMPAYINDLIDYLRESFDTGSRVIFETDIAEAEFDVTRAVPLGLILNEAITNSIKYAFPENHTGLIKISMIHTDHNSYILRISDNGIGLASNENVTKSKTLGMSLIRGLSKQVDGTFEVESDQGFAIIIEFTDDKFLKNI